MTKQKSNGYANDDRSKGERGLEQNRGSYHGRGATMTTGIEIEGHLRDDRGRHLWSRCKDVFNIRSDRSRVENRVLASARDCRRAYQSASRIEPCASKSEPYYNGIADVALAYHSAESQSFRPFVPSSITLRSRCVGITSAAEASGSSCKCLGKMLAFVRDPRKIHRPTIITKLEPSYDDIIRRMVTSKIIFRLLLAPWPFDA